MPRFAPSLLPAAIALGVVLALPPAAGEAAPPAPPKAASDSWRQGLEAMTKGQWVECIENFNRVIASDPAYAASYLNLGRCQSEMGQWPEAIRTYERGLAQSPDDSLRFDMLTALSRSQQSSEQFPAAIRTYEELIKMRPNDKDVMVSYAFALKTVDRGVDAAMAYLRAIELAPSDVALIKVASELCEQNEMLEQAIALYERWTVLEPENVEPFRYLAYLLYQAESCDRGLQVYEKTIALDPANPGDMLNLGLLYQRCEQYDKALAMLQHYRAMRPDTTAAAIATIDCRLAFLYEDMNKVAEGIAFVRDAVKESGDDPCLLYAWGRLLEKQALDLVQQEKFDDAVSTYRQAQAKLQPVVGGGQWGDSASKQLKRLEQLIKIAEAKKQQSESQ